MQDEDTMTITPNALNKEPILVLKEEMAEWFQRCNHLREEADKTESAANVARRRLAQAEAVTSALSEQWNALHGEDEEKRADATIKADYVIRQPRTA